MDSEYNPYKIENGKEIQIIGDSDGDIYSGSWCIDQMDKDDDMITFGTFEDKIRGPRQLAQLTLDSTYKTNLITGVPGHGKEEMIRNIKIQIAKRGLGLINIIHDQKSTQEFINRIPRDRIDDVILVNYPYGRDERSIGFNMLEPPIDENHEAYEQYVEDISNDLVQILKDRSDNWGPQIGNMTDTMINQLVQAEHEFDLADLVKIIADEEEKEAFVQNYGGELQQVFMQRIAEQDMEFFDPILRRIRAWVKDRTVRNVIANSESNLNLRDAILDDKIVIFNLAGIEDSTTHQVISDMITMRIKNATSTLQDTKTHVFEQLGGSSMFSNSLMSETKDTDVGVFVSIDRMNGFDNESKRILRSFMNKQSFSTQQDNSEASVIAQMFDIASKDIMNLDEYQCISYIMTQDGYRSEVPVEVTVFRDRPPISERDLNTVSELSLNQYGGNNKADFEDAGCLKYLN